MDADQTPLYDAGWVNDFPSLTDKVGCDNRTCTNEADYFITTVCCNRPNIACRNCLRTFLAIQEKRQASGYTYKCDCGKESLPMEVHNNVQRLRLTPPE